MMKRQQLEPYGILMLINRLMTAEVKVLTQLKAVYAALLVVVPIVLVQ